MKRRLAGRGGARCGAVVLLLPSLLLLPLLALLGVALARKVWQVQALRQRLDELLVHGDGSVVDTGTPSAHSADPTAMAFTYGDLLQLRDSLRDSSRGGQLQRRFAKNTAAHPRLSKAFLPAQQLLQHKSQAVQAATSKGPYGQKSRHRVRAFIGVFTGFTTSDIAKYDYEARRATLRQTWFPGNATERRRWEKQHGVVMRFIIGSSGNATRNAALDKEAAQHDDFLRLPIQEHYNQLSNKSRAFFGLVGSLYEADWVVKVDDDVYVMPQRLLLAMNQWDKIGAGYVGCMKRGPVLDNPASRYYEPNHLLLGEHYYLHAAGGIYALSGRTVDNVVVRNLDHLRLFANEDTTVGGWMMSHNVTHFEDMRLCVTQCNPAAVAILRQACGGLCNPLYDLLALQEDARCQETPLELAYIPSYVDHKAFEEMWV